MDDINKALQVGGLTSGQVLQVEELEATLKMVTFNMSNLTPWGHVDIYEGYDLVDLHGKLKIGILNYTDAVTIFGMFEALMKVHIIRDAKFAGGERMYVDSRSYVE